MLTLAACGGNNNSQPVTLNRVTGLSFNNSTLTLSWNAVANASGYEIRIAHLNPALYDETVQVATTSYIVDNNDFLGIQGQINFTVRTKGTGNFKDSTDTSSAMWFRNLGFLAMPRDLALDRTTGVVSWAMNTQAGASTPEGFVLQLNYKKDGQDVEETFTTTEMFYNFAPEKFVGITPVTMRVQATHSSIDIQNSGVEGPRNNFIRLEQPTNLEFHRSSYISLTWDAVENATSYDMFYYIYPEFGSYTRLPYNSTSYYNSTTPYSIQPINIYSNTVLIRIYLRANATNYLSSEWTMIEYRP